MDEFKVGDRVLIVSGPWKGHVASISRYPVRPQPFIEPMWTVEFDWDHRAMMLTRQMQLVKGKE